MDALLEAYAYQNIYDVENGDFSSIEIKPSLTNESFLYFYDNNRRSLVKHFLLYKGDRVLTLCEVKLIAVEDKYSPRLRFWKAHKTAVKEIATEIAPQAEIPNIETKASVDVSKGQANFWKLIGFIQSFAEIDIPRETFRILNADAAEIAEEFFRDSDKRTILEAFGRAYAGDITQSDLDLIANRRGQLERFRRLLYDPEFFDVELSAFRTDRPEDLWQDFFETNAWIFGYGLSLVSSEALGVKLEQIAVGASILTGGGKRADGLLRMRGVVSGLLFCEIKHHRTKLLRESAYRPPDVYSPTSELVGGIAQVQKTASKTIGKLFSQMLSVYEDDGTPTSLEITTVRPRQCLVIGNSSEFQVADGRLNGEKVSSFELYRRSILDTEVITFDELYQRARFIIEG